MTTKECRKTKLHFILLKKSVVFLMIAIFFTLIGDEEVFADVTVYITGEVAYVAPQWADLLHITAATETTAGTSVSGYYTYDESTIDANYDELEAIDTNPSFGEYLHNNASYGMHVTIGDYTFETDPEDVQFAMQIFNDFALS